MRQEQETLTDDIIRVAPLSAAQRQIWVVHQINGQNRAYDIVWALRMRGELDVPRMEHAFGAVVGRHDALRTTYHHDRGQPFQRVHRYNGFSLEMCDLTGVPAAAREAEKDRLIAERIAVPMDLGTGPVFEAVLFRLGLADHLLLIRVHHIAADAAALGVLYRELCACYAEAGELPELPVQYTDLAVEEHRRLADADESPGLRYWREALDGLGEPVGMPTDQGRPERAGFGGAHEPIANLALSREIRELGAACGATPFAVLAAALAILLHRHSGENDITIGTPASGRTERTRDLIGLLINLLVLRIQVTGTATVREVVGAARDAALDAMTFQDIPFEYVVRAVNPDRSATANPLFRVLLAYHASESPAVPLPGIEVTWETVRAETSQFDMSLHLTETSSGLTGYLEYSTDLFGQTTARRFVDRLTTLLAAMATDPDAEIGALPVVSPAEQDELRRIGRGPDRPEYLDGSLPELLRESLDRSPDTVAVRAQGRRWTYRELHADAAAVASRLAALRVRPDQFVAVVAERGMSFVTAVLGVIRSGAAFLPLDPGDPAHRLAGLLADSQACVVLTQRCHSERIPPGPYQVVVIEDAVEEAADSPPWPTALSQDSAAYAIYTSGTTGHPKAAVNTQRGIVNRLRWMRAEFGVGPSDVVLHKTPCGFDVWVWECLLPLISGATLVVAPPGAHREPRTLARLMAAEGVTIVHFVPTMLRLYLDDPAASLPASLRLVVSSGETLDEPLARRFATNSPAELVNLYGPAECAIDVTAWRPDPRRPDRPVTIGRPISNVRVLVLDESGRELPIGAAGELHIGGAAVGPGYLGRPELTAAAFWSDRHDRLYRTGDRARLLPSGEIEYLGRRDGQVKVHGMRIETGEIEAVLREHDAVAQAAVLLRDDTPAGQALVGYVAGPTHASVTELRRYLASRLPEPMIPSYFVAMGALPLSAGGKVARSALPAPVAASSTDRLAPRTETEQVLCSVWSDVLGISDIGVEDNFFALGGDSVQAIRVAIQSGAAGFPRSARQLFQHQTIAALAAAAAMDTRIDAGGLAPASPANARGIADRYPAGPLQDSMLVRYHEIAEPDLYMVQRVFPATGSLDVDRFRQSWQLLVDRHTMLRTSFDDSDLDRPEQLVHARAELDFHHLDWSAEPAEKQQALLADYLERQRETGFALHEPAPLRMALIDTGPGTYEWILQFNYMCLDGWTLAILFDELSQIYPAVLEGRDPDLPAAQPYRRYIDWVQRQSLPRARAYWRREMLGHPAQPELPTVLGATPEATDGVSRCTRHLTEADSRRLRRAAEAASVTLNTLVQGAWALLLSRLTGQDQVVFGVTSTGRTSGPPELMQIPGAMLNTLPVSVTVRRGTPLPAWLADLQERQAEMRDYEYTPPRLLAGWIDREPADLLFDSYIVFQNLESIRGPHRGLPGVDFPTVDPFFHVKREHPVRLDVFPAARISMHLTYHRNRMNHMDAERLLGDFAALLDELARHGDPQL